MQKPLFKSDLCRLPLLNIAKHLQGDVGRRFRRLEHFRPAGPRPGGRPDLRGEPRLFRPRRAKRRFRIIVDGEFTSKKILIRPQRTHRLR